ncbi:MAG: NAD(P)/FAD-dependent oxidoreductase [Promethearchaeota archaeon]
MYDITIIGGGVTGCAIARWLSKYKLKTILVEKHEDVASETTKGNSAVIHAGYAAPDGSLRCKMNVRSNPMFDQAHKELNFGFKRVGSFVVAFTDENMKTLEHELKQAKERNIPGEIITDIKRIKTMEPNISDKVKGIFYAPTAALVWPFGLTVALAENAFENGVEFLFSSPVTDIQKNENGFTIKAGETQIKTKVIINAAGVFADDIAKMVGANDFTITPRKGEYILMDRGSAPINYILFPTPTIVSKGILVCPTLEGHTFIGPNAQNQDDKNDVSTSSAGLNEIIVGGRNLLPSIPIRSAITNFAGLRAVSNRNGDFIIEPSKVENFINVAGICSPGLSSCLAIAEYVEEIVKKHTSLEMVKNPDWNPNRIPQKRLEDMNEDELSAAIKERPQWGRIVCRCETVSEAEIVDCIHRSIPSTSMDMIKKRIRPGMGRCQGGFCTPKILKILSRELNKPVTEITKNDVGSEMVIARTKHLEVQPWKGDKP